MLLSRGLGALSAVLVAGGLLAGCAQVNKAPVEDRGGWGSASTTRVDPSTLPGAENAGKPGYYTVQPGDTLIRIGLEHGQSWKDVARWSNLTNPDLIEVGQVVRVVPPGAAVGVQSQGTRPVASTTVQPVTLPPAGSAASTPATAPVATAPTSAESAASSAGGDASGLGFMWPASGAVIAGFNESTNKGVDIAGKAGDPIVAAADGRVVYAGAGLRGYGHLVILKHNNTYLTAYAHNQKLLVKEDQNVKKGQKIAEMGNTDADRVKLHFEVRRQGKPVDPSRYLPAR
ncbi:peptidoglycan DD-metalloendopeptidase family protein [Comamonas jiangduensis]|uniref:Peptidoglycan DD-metalloendopeptidase family protein n=1 Tax=Comamonas jiangduensis TaxID=1194168 RepID=A0ABV4IF17_9BURK|nr:peptidoglycan DD-metalloendopeptidase family protein [Comamonas jiangduensis]